MNNQDSNLSPEVVGINARYLELKDADSNPGSSIDFGQVSFPLLASILHLEAWTG